MSDGMLCKDKYGSENQHVVLQIPCGGGEVKCVSIDEIKKYYDESKGFLTKKGARDHATAGGLVCCHGARMVAVLEGTKAPHFRHYTENANANGMNANVPLVACGCGISHEHLQAQLQLEKWINDGNKLECVQMRQCGSGARPHGQRQAYVSSIGATARMEARLIVGRKYRVDIEIQNAQGEREMIIEVWHEHRTNPNDRTGTPYIEISAGEVLKAIETGTLRAESVHLIPEDTCPICEQERDQQLKREERKAARLNCARGDHDWNEGTDYDSNCKVCGIGHNCYQREQRRKRIEGDLEGIDFEYGGQGDVRITHPSTKQTVRYGLRNRSLGVEGKKRRLMPYAPKAIKQWYNSREGLLPKCNRCNEIIKVCENSTSHNLFGVCQNNKCSSTYVNNIQFN
jgi:hypothetical protein